MKKLVPFRSVVIFGGAGFVGSNWAHRLLRTTDAKIHVFDNLSRAGVQHNLNWLRKAAPDSERLKITIADVRDAALVEKAVQGATEIYHFAAQVAVTTSIDDPRLDYEVNVGVTFYIMEVAWKSFLYQFMLFIFIYIVYSRL